MATARDQLRPVTALFADITGSTGLGERLAPDEVKALIGECVTRMSRAVEEFGGTVQAYQGDGICAYFGVPVAHEDDPQRAARAAFRILDLMAEYGREAAAAWGVHDLNVRIGINGGRMGVGQVGAGDPQTVALGDATNVAARLEAAAQPGSIVVGEETARRLARQFKVEPLGPIAVKGREQTVEAWSLVAPATEGVGGNEPGLIGRSAELERLTGALERLVEGRGQVVVVVGDAGLGKSRLLREARALTGGRATWLAGQSVSYGGRAPFGPFVEVLRTWLGSPEGEPPLAARTRLRARLGAQHEDRLPELGRLLGIRMDEEAETALGGLSPADLADRLRSAYVEWVAGLARRDPVVLSLDDVNWIDTASAELTADLMALTDHRPLGLVLTMRPEVGSAGWNLRSRAIGEYAHRLTNVDLEPLTATAAAELVAELVPAGGLDPGTLRTLVEISEGNPLYLEQLLARLQETGGLEHHQTWTLTVPRSVLPPALEGLLVARLDALPPEPRAVAEAAAVIGRVFGRPVLERVTGGDLDASLEHLLRARIIEERGRYPEPSYAFRAGLVHEAALGTLTDARRAELHQAIAAAYEDLAADRVDDHLEELAHHYARAHDLHKALEYLERGAQRATGLAATDEAERLWLRALRTANRLGDEAAAERIRTAMSAIGATAGPPDEEGQGAAD
jgi:class 3 adenylate cyclase